MFADIISHNSRTNMSTVYASKFNFASGLWRSLHLKGYFLSNRNCKVANKLNLNAVKLKFRQIEAYLPASQFQHKDSLERIAHILSMQYFVPHTKQTWEHGHGYLCNITSSTVFSVTLTEITNRGYRIPKVAQKTKKIYIDSIQCTVHGVLPVQKFQRSTYPGTGRTLCIVR